MDFELTPQVEELRERVRAFMDEHVYPDELEAMRALDAEVAPGTPFPEILVEMRAKARAEGLWNLFLPDERYGPGLANWQYGVLCEEMGRSPAVAPMVFNCQPPTPATWRSSPSTARTEQRERWLQPLLDGDIRSCFSMTEPETSGSDPTSSCPRRARRRRLGHQRPQVVDDRRPRRLGGDRHGGHRPRRRIRTRGRA